jgi:competence protein ComGC
MAIAAATPKMATVISSSNKVNAFACLNMRLVLLFLCFVSHIEVRNLMKTNKIILDIGYFTLSL